MGRKSGDTGKIKARWESHRAEPKRIIFIGVPDVHPSEPYMKGEDGEVRVCLVTHDRRTGRTVIGNNLFLPLCKVGGKWRVMQAF